MPPLRVAVIGLGAFGERHVATLASLPQVEVVAVVSRRPERAAEIAARYGIAAPFTDYALMFDAVQPDAVTVATAENAHRDPVIAALEAGASVLVEKPMASTVEDAQAMLEAAATAPGFLMPGHLLRFDARYAGIKATITAGEVGEIVSLVARRNRPRSLITSHGRVHPVLVTGIHDLDIMLWLTGQHVERVRAHHQLATRGSRGHGVWALLEFSGGAIGILETSWLIPERAGIETDDTFEVVGDRGTIRAPISAGALQIWREAGPISRDVGYEPLLHGQIAGALREELAYFTACARTGARPTIVTPRDGLNALVVAQAIIASAEQGTEVRVSWPEPPGGGDPHVD